MAVKCPLDVLWGKGINQALFLSYYDYHKTSSLSIAPWFIYATSIIPPRLSILSDIHCNQAFDMFIKSFAKGGLPLILASLVSSAPSSSTFLDDRDELFKGASYLGGQLPSCQGDANDPSQSPPQTLYTDNEGSYIDWDCESGNSNGPQDCWFV